MKGLLVLMGLFIHPFVYSQTESDLTQFDSTKVEYYELDSTGEFQNFMTVVRYFEDNLLIRLKSYSNGTMNIEKRYSYNNLNQLSEETLYSKTYHFLGDSLVEAKMNPSSKIVYFYNDSLVSKELYFQDSSMAPSRKTSYFYNSEDVIISKIIKESNLDNIQDSVIYKTNYFFHGYDTTRVEYDINLDLKSYILYIGTFKNPKETKSYLSDGTLFKHIIYKRDELGCLIQTETKMDKGYSPWTGERVDYFLDGNIINYTYDKNCLLLKKEVLENNQVIRKSIYTYY